MTEISEELRGKLKGCITFMLWVGLISIAIFFIVRANRKPICNISDGTHIAKMEHYPRIKFMLSDYVVVKVKDGKIIEIYVDKAKSERHSIQLQKDSTGIVRYTEGEAYDIRIIK